MGRIVQKFGGTSVATLERIKHVAEIIAESRQNHEIVAVVSAMAGVTNKFVDYAHNLGGYEGNPEYDFVVSSGEIVTAGLLSIALKNIGIPSRSYAGWQVPIHTTSEYGAANIESVDINNLEQDLNNGIIPVVCGFQGINEKNRITTLGRGGSDLTAVAISDAIKSDQCDIYSDIDGVYTVDPNLYIKARRLERICYDEMLEMAALGAKVLQEQSVAYALKKQVKIRVASSFVKNEGTIICEEVPYHKFCGIAVTHNLVQLGISFQEEYDIASQLENCFVRIDIVKTSPNKMSILVDRKKLTLVKEILNNIKAVTGVKQEMVRRHYSRVSVIGSNFEEDEGAQIIGVLKSVGIEVFCCSQKKYGINLVLSTENLLKAVDVLHKNCGLENE